MERTCRVDGTFQRYPHDTLGSKRTLGRMNEEMTSIGATVVVGENNVLLYESCVIRIRLGKDTSYREEGTGYTKPPG